MAYTNLEIDNYIDSVFGLKSFLIEKQILDKYKKAIIDANGNIDSISSKLEPFYSTFTWLDTDDGREYWHRINTLFYQYKCKLNEEI